MHLKNYRKLTHTVNPVKQKGKYLSRFKICYNSLLVYLHSQYCAVTFHAITPIWKNTHANQSEKPAKKQRREILGWDFLQ
jgi:hypothetical protein